MTLLHKKSFSKSEFLIIANGPYDPKLVQLLAPNKTIIALDGAINQIKKITPHYILGDFDSISTSAFKRYKKLKIPLIELKDQQKTDLEKGINFAKKLKAKKIYICCALGEDRFDHNFSAFSLLKKTYSKNCPTFLITSSEMIRFVKDEVFYFRAAVGQTCGFLGWPKATVTTLGLKWDVKNWNTEIGGPISTSNQVRKEEVKIKVKGELLLIQPFHG